MAVLTAAYADFAETTIFTTFDDRPDSFVPDNLDNGIRQLIAEWEALPNTIDPFEDAARVTEAKGLADGILRAGQQAYTEAQTVTEATWTFTYKSTTLLLLNANQNAGGGNINAEDDSGTIRTLTNANQTNILAAFAAQVVGDQLARIIEKNIIDGRATLALIDSDLAASGFGVLGPVYQ